MKKMNNISRMISAAALAAVIAMFASCGNSGSTAESTGGGETTTVAEETKKSGKSAVVFENEGPEENADEALAFLEERVPHYAQFLKKRTVVPLVLETSITNAQGEWVSNLYIKDDQTFAMYTKDPTGVEKRVVYIGTMGYQTDSSQRVIWSTEIGKAGIKEAYDSYRIALFPDIIKQSRMSQGVDEYDGKLYDTETLSSDESSTTHYFDQETGELVYSITGDNVSKIVKLENTVPDESVFELPADYEKKDYEEYLKELQEMYESSAAEQDAAPEEAQQ